MAWSSLFIVYEIALAEFLLGMVVNGFITVINLMDWRAVGKLTPFDKIFLSLGLSRMSHMCLSIFNIINRVFQWGVYDIEVLNWMFNTMYLFLDFSSLWFAMWLCVLYYVKVGIFKNAILVHFRLNISGLVLNIILSSLLISFFSGFCFAYNYNENLDIMFPTNIPSSNRSIDQQLQYMAPSYFFGHFLPFIFVSVSSLFLIETLLVHVKSLRDNMTSFASPRMDAHLTAIRAVFLVQLLTICYLIVTLLLRFDFFEGFDRNIMFMLVSSYPTFHSLVLIMANSKLKTAALRILRCVKKCDNIGNYCIKPQEVIHADTSSQQHEKA